jgi:hypothetical protein
VDYPDVDTVLNRALALQETPVEADALQLRQARA